MHYATIKWYDVSNGPGVRVSLYVSGCRNRCKNCFNPETWDFDFGQPFDRAVEDTILATLEPSYMNGMTVLGGEPMEPENQRDLLPFLRRYKEQYPQKPLWLFTGNTYEELQPGGIRYTEHTAEILQLLDILVDGRFVEDLKDLKLRFRGSSNQRIIDMNKTRETGEITIWEGVEHL